MSGFKSLKGYQPLKITVRYMGLTVLGVLRGSCFVAQAGLELVILLIAGIMVCVIPAQQGFVYSSPTAAL